MLLSVEFLLLLTCARKMNIRITSILCFFGCLQLADSKQLQLRQCDKHISTKLLHGSYIEYGGRIRIYRCNKGYIINIEDGLQFQCTYKDNRYNVTSRKYPTLSVTHIKCERKKSCSGTSPNENVEIIEKKRYKLKRDSKTYRAMKRQGYFEGDEIEYRCKAGYADTGAPNQLSFYDGIDYGDDNETETTTYSGICERSGNKAKWTGIDGNKTLEQPNCTPILCDASRFVSVEYGYILNYTYTYGYLDYMELQCDPGYSPIDGKSSALCFDSLSFTDLSLPVFGCEETLCPEPGIPIDGSYECDNRFNTLGTNCTFSCKSGYTLVGSSHWTCMEDGRWSESCVKCTHSDQYCENPCVPTGSVVSTLDPTNFINSTIDFSCSDDYFVNGTVSRTCMKNRKWSESDIDCLGDMYFKQDAALGLVSSLENMRKMKEANMTFVEDAVGVKTIDPNSDTCCDIYILLDMSKSMTEDDFNNSRKFIKTLLPEIGISNTEGSTAVSLYLFATKFVAKIEQHYPYKEASERFENYTYLAEEIDNLDRKKIIEKVGQSTDLSLALEKIEMSAESKRRARKTANIGLRDNVLILLSDGEYTGGGEPEGIATRLKNKLEFQIYSVAMGTDRKDINRVLMKRIASPDDPAEPKDKHYIAIDMKKLSEIIDNMINKESPESTKCGSTDETLTDIHIRDAPMDKDAKPGAWPWMVQLRTEMGGICGGSLIDKQWILTAAHCLTDNTVTKVRFKSTLYDKANAEYHEVSKANMFIHREYNRSREPTHVYDIALIKLSSKVLLSEELHTVCLWNNTYKDLGIPLESLYESDKFGVVTGWGPRPGQDGHSEFLKQLQIKIQKKETCSNVVDEKHTDFRHMFCAGSQSPDSETGYFIDSCKGDSGGPFVVENPKKENFYIQTGIVSFGDNCGDEGKYGFYTKLNQEMLKWISKTMQDSED